jgi:predicted permease
LPGVEHAGYVSNLPFLTTGNTTGYQIEGGEPIAQDALYRVATPGYLQTLGVELVEGRLPDERDTQESMPVVVINATLARLHWPDGGAIGRRVRFGGTAAPFRTVIGVVRDVRERGYQPEMKPGAYVLYSQAVAGFIPEFLVVRTARDPLTFAPAVRRVIGETDAEQPVSTIRTMEQILDASVVDRSSQTRLLAAFAGLALLLACIGLYGLLAYAVAQRRREIGVRLALGATSGAIARMIVYHGIALTGIGLAIGLATALGTTLWLRSLLYGVEATDVATFTAVIGLLMVIATAACAIPALRAARVDPLRVLREP